MHIARQSLHLQACKDAGEGLAMALVPEVALLTSDRGATVQPMSEHVSMATGEARDTS